MPTSVKTVLRWCEPCSSSVRWGRVHRWRNRVCTTLAGGGAHSDRSAKQASRTRALLLLLLYLMFAVCRGPDGSTPRREQPVLAVVVVVVFPEYCCTEYCLWSYPTVGVPNFVRSGSGVSLDRLVRVSYRQCLAVFCTAQVHHAMSSFSIRA